MTDHLHALPVGHQLNEYRIENVIGSGGFGITYRAWDIQLDKAVAIKEYLPNEFAVRTDATTVRPKSTADQDNYQWGLTRFLDEARTLARFEHPHLNHVHRYFEDNNTAYLVLDYIEGETLSDLLKREGQLESTRLQRLVAELLSGLDEVHSAGYVHRDIKPSNIMVRANGSSVLLDFGAARQVLGQRSKSLTSVLTPGYAPIEQYDQKGDDIGPWTDLYALGMVAYRCVSGISETELIDAITRARLANKGKQDQDMKPAVEIGKGHYPSSLLKAIDWAIKVEEEDRPQNVAAIKEMIAGDEVPDNVPDAVPVDKPAKQPIKQQASPKPEQFWVWFWVVAVVPLFVLIVWFAALDHDERLMEERAAGVEQREEAKQVAEAAHQGDTVAQYNLGVMYLNGYGVAQNSTEAVKWFRKAAEHGHALGQNNLGVMYQNGYGVAQDYKEAIKWYRKAAMQGEALGQNNLGSMYLNSYGVYQDDKEAAQWFRKAAEQGEVLGQHNLGVMYLNGYGVYQNDMEAAKWFRKAAEQGNADAQYRLGEMYFTGKGVAQDYTEAVKWLHKTIEQGNTDAQNTLGVMYETGRGFAQNYTEAVKWYRKSAEGGNAGGQNNLGTMYAKGYGVYQDDTEAVKWFREAAANKEALGQNNLGVMYQYGYGVAQNYTEALTWYRKSAEQGEALGQYNLGRMYQKGLGVPQDDTEAAKWYRKAAAQGHAGAKEVLEDL